MINKFLTTILLLFLSANFIFASNNIENNFEENLNSTLILTTYDYQKNEYKFFKKNNIITVINKNNQKVGAFEYTGDEISVFYKFLPYAKIKKNNKYAYYDPKKNKLSKFYDDIRIAPQRASIIFFKDDIYLQYKEFSMYHNFDKKITPRKILLLPVEIPIATIHDLGEMVLIFGTFGLYYVFNGSDWWLTGKGVQGLP